MKHYGNASRDAARFGAEGDVNRSWQTIKTEVARLHQEAEFWRLKFGEESASHDRDGKALYRVSRELEALRATPEGFRKG